MVFITAQVLKKTALTERKKVAWGKLNRGSGKRSPRNDKKYLRTPAGVPDNNCAPAALQDANFLGDFSWGCAYRCRG